MYSYLFVVICFAYVHMLCTYMQLILVQRLVQNHHFCGWPEILNDYRCC